MALTSRQKRLYTHLCNVYSVSSSIDATTKKRSADTPTLIASNVPCLYDYTQNFSDGTEIGRLKRASVLTTDSVHMEANVEVKDGYYIKNVSLLPDGSNSPLYGQIHRVQGDPFIVPSSGHRQANYQELEINTLEHPVTLP